MASRPADHPDTPPDDGLITLPLHRNGVLVGSVTLDLPALRDALDAHIAARGDGYHVADIKALRGRLIERWRGLGGYYTNDLCWHLQWPSLTESGREQATVTTPPPQPIADAEQATHGHANIVAGLGALLLLADLEQPVTDVLANPPLIVGPDDRRRPSGFGGRVPTFGEYVALAQATGDGRALDAIEAHLRRNQHAGPHRRDWTDILAWFDAVRAVLVDIKSNGSLTDADDRTRVLAEIENDLDLQAMWQKRRVPFNRIAMGITAKWKGCEVSTLRKEINRRNQQAAPRVPTPLN